MGEGLGSWGALCLLSNMLSHLSASFRMAAASRGLSMSSSSHDNGIENFREKLLDIDNKLGNQEVEKLKFLCQDFVSHKNLEKCSSALDIFNHLLTGKLLSEEDPFFLAELLYIIKQNSLLKYLSYTKEQVERLLPMKKKVSLFRWGGICDQDRRAFHLIVSIQAIGLWKEAEIETFCLPTTLDDTLILTKRFLSSKWDERLGLSGLGGGFP